jgi:hypothetical protein
MPAYRVVSGEFDATIVRDNPEKAAQDAIARLRDGEFDKIKLGLFTEISLICTEEKESPFYMPTEALVKHNGLSYRRCC